MSAHTVFYKKIRAKSSFFYGFCLLCIIFTAGNIIISQKYDSAMYGVMNGESSSTISYLRHIWGTPLFSLEMETYRNGQNKEMLAQWSQVQSDNSNRIAHLVAALKQHPYAPELYYNLSLLYSEDGQVKLALENLHKAQQIDPSLK